MRTLRIFALCAAVASLVLAVAGPASAHISQFQITSHGWSEGSDQAEATGTITCTAGETFIVRLNAAQKVTGWRGTGETAAQTCTGSQQGWNVVTTSESGELQCFFNDPANSRVRMTVAARTLAGGVIDDREKAYATSVHTFCF